MAIEEQKAKIMNLARSRAIIKTNDIVRLFGVSRQYAKLLINDLIIDEKLIKIGSTRSARYILSEYASKHIELFPSRIVKILKNENLEEHKVLNDVENHLPLLLKLPENVRSIFDYGFSEILNNAIEHSQSNRILVNVEIKDKKLNFRITDFGIGVFRNIMQKRHLKSELGAIQDLLKGKVTTQPESHSGEGIFFTSRVSDIFILDSFGIRLIINNIIGDIFLNQSRAKRGTEVSFMAKIDSPKHLNDIFKKYTNVATTGDLTSFDKTEVKIKLYTLGGIHISRSQARRVLADLNKFKSIVFDFDKVPTIGQAFADEIFRVFHNKYPQIKLQAIGANEAVQFMIDRVEGKNPRKSNLFGDSYMEK